MDGLIIGFEGEKTLKVITGILESDGISIRAAYRSGAEIKRLISQMDSGVVLCGYKLLDETAENLNEDLPKEFSMLMLATQEQLSMCEMEDIYKIAAPVKRFDLVSAVKMLLNLDMKPQVSLTHRTEEEHKLINQAKELLMERHFMTEQEAHRFLQKRSMDTGRKMVHTAKLVLGDTDI